MIEVEEITFSRGSIGGKEALFATTILDRQGLVTREYNLGIEIETHRIFGDYIGADGWVDLDDDEARELADKFGLVAPMIVVAEAIREREGIPYRMKDDAYQALQFYGFNSNYEYVQVKDDGTWESVYFNPNGNQGKGQLVIAKGDLETALNEWDGTLSGCDSREPDHCIDFSFNPAGWDYWFDKYLRTFNAERMKAHPYKAYPIEGENTMYADLTKALEEYKVKTAAYVLQDSHGAPQCDVETLYFESYEDLAGYLDAYLDVNDRITEGYAIVTDGDRYRAAIQAPESERSKSEPSCTYIPKKTEPKQVSPKDDIAQAKCAIDQTCTQAQARKQVR